MDFSEWWESADRTALSRFEVARAAWDAALVGEGKEKEIKRLHAIIDILLVHANLPER